MDLIYVTVSGFEDVDGILWLAHSLLVVEGLVSRDLGQEEVVKWFHFVVTSALHVAFENEDMLYSWT